MRLAQSRRRRARLVYRTLDQRTLLALPDRTARAVALGLAHIVPALIGLTLRAGGLALSGGYLRRRD